MLIMTFWIKLGFWNLQDTKKHHEATRVRQENSENDENIVSETVQDEEEMRREGPAGEAANARENVKILKFFKISRFQEIKIFNI